MSVHYLSDYRKRQESLSDSQKSQLLANINWAEIGQTHIDFSTDEQQLLAFWLILDRSARKPFTLKSDFARSAAWYVAVCATKGLISIEIDQDVFGDRWAITAEGEDFMETIDAKLREITKG